MTDSIQKMTDRIFRSFHFHLEKDPSKGVPQIQKVLEASLRSSVYTASVASPSMSAVGVVRPPKTAAESAREYAGLLHQEIYNKPVERSRDAIQMQTKRSDLAKYLLASALFFSKLQEDSVNCHGLVTALSNTSLSEEIDVSGYQNFGMIFGFFSSLDSEEKQAKFQQLKGGAKKEGENSCRQFGDFFHTSQIRETWSQNFAGMMKCFESDARVLGCLEKK